MVAKAQSHSRAQQDAVIAEAISAVLSTVDLATVLERTAKLLRGHFGETRVAVHRRAEGSDSEVETLLVEDPRHPAAEPERRFPLEGSACGRAMALRQKVIVEGLDPAHPRFREEEVVGRLGYGSLVCFPLVFEDQVLGTLDIAHLPQDGLLACCMKTAEQIAHLVAIALHNSLMVEEIRRLNRLLDQENALLRDEVRQLRRDHRYVAHGSAMREVVDRVRLVASSDTTVLIRGETGTGKEGLARMIHEFSPRFGRPFVVVNLGAIPETLIESELFGHEKGSFTGATARRRGKFEQAEGGTIFLDEVGDAPLPVQVKLLRVLQERELTRVGGNERIPVNVRVVAATNRPLEQLVSDGTFRSDFYYRLNVFPLHLPTLRERREEIRPLVQHFLATQAATMHRKPPVVSEAAWQTLESAPWPGNVRELENFVQRALILSPGAELVVAPIPGLVPAAPAEGLRGEATAPRGTPEDRTNLGAAIAAGQARGEERSAVPLPAATRNVAVNAGGTSTAPVARFEDEMRALLKRALEATGGRIYGPTGAAAMLGLKPTTLQGKLRKYGLARTMVISSTSG